MRPISRQQHYAGVALGALGLGILLMEVVRYWQLSHPIHAWPVVIGATIGFVGGTMLDARTARDSGEFVVDSAVRIIGVVRSGRRSTDERVVATPDAGDLNAADESGESGNSTGSVPNGSPPQP